MKTQIVCAKCGKALVSGQHDGADDIFFAENGLIFCSFCGREYTTRIKREQESEREREMQNARICADMPSREEFDSDITYYIALAKAMGASDLHLNEGCGPFFRMNGSLEVVSKKKLTREEILTFLSARTDVDTGKLLRSDTAVDFSLTVGDVRLRGNVYKDNNGVNMALRLLVMVSGDFADLGIPGILKRLSERRSGLILITGPTGSGKTTTLTCLIEHINRTRHEHIIMLEDPIEFLHDNAGCLISQREIGRDAHSFSDAITEAMREDPDIIMVGEMRDHASIEAALRAAETGHLVLSTLHTKGAVNSITRIVDVFPASQQNQIRTQLGMSLLGVVSQQLLPGTVKGKRHLATEVLIATEPVRAMIRQDKLHMVASTIQTSSGDGMYTMKSSMERLLRERKITEETFESYLI